VLPRLLEVSRHGRTKGDRETCGVLPIPYLQREAGHKELKPKVYSEISVF
jgi:hypothetical protein